MKSGFVAILGRPNVGKSTIMNKLIGFKIAAVSSRAQTTRKKIQTVYIPVNLPIEERPDFERNIPDKCKPGSVKVVLDTKTPDTCPHLSAKDLASPDLLHCYMLRA